MKLWSKESNFHSKKENKFCETENEVFPVQFIV